MKKIIQLNIKGLLFNLDEDAYQLMSSYIIQLRNHYKTVKEGDDILDDLENRIAEHLNNKINETKKVITLSDVKEVIDTIGKLKDFEPQASGEDYKEYKGQRRLYRDLVNSAIGGVASGLAAYFNIDVIWLRIGFVFAAFFSGFGILLYLLMWAIVPRAKTVAQKLEMQGKNVTIENIENNVKEEYERVKESISNLRSNGNFKHTEARVLGFFRGIGNLFAALFKFIVGAIGAALIFAGIMAIIALTIVWLQGNGNFNIFYEDISFNVHQFLGHFISEGMIQPLLLATWTAVLIPLLSLIYGGIKILFNIKVDDRPVGMLLFIAWVIAIIFTFSVAFIQYQDFQTREKVVETVSLDKVMSDTLYVYAENTDWDDDCCDFEMFGKDYVIELNEGVSTIYGEPEFEVLASPDEYYHLNVQKFAYGDDTFDATENIKSISYTWSLENNELYFDNLFLLDNQALFRLQHMNIQILVPEDKYIYFNSESDVKIKRMKGDYKHYNIGDRYWKAGKNNFYLMN